MTMRPEVALHGRSCTGANQYLLRCFHKIIVQGRLIAECTGHLIYVKHAVDPGEQTQDGYTAYMYCLHEMVVALETYKDESGSKRRLADGGMITTLLPNGCQTMEDLVNVLHIYVYIGMVA